MKITTRKGMLVVLGNGEVQREVPLNALVRQVLDEWLVLRNALAGEGERAGGAGGRSSARSAGSSPLLRPFSCLLTRCDTHV